MEARKNQVLYDEAEEFEKILKLFRGGKFPEKEFQAFRLTRGVYGQRQQGVQMIRLKIPFGGLNPKQLRRIGQVALDYGNGWAHVTTRQDIQYHYVSINRVKELLETLAQVGVHSKEACGNSVRNVTASPTAGIDPLEAFDVTPVAEAIANYFLRNPVCQDLGRKFKIALSSRFEDDAIGAIHDIGLIAVLQGGKPGFKIWVGGGLGFQPIHAQLYGEFVPVGEVLPLITAILRVFDRHGERAKRSQARMKFLVKKWGIEEFRKQVQEELRVIPNEIPIELAEETFPDTWQPIPSAVARAGAWLDRIDNPTSDWQKTNVIRQKQQGFVAAYIRLPLGDAKGERLIELANLLEQLEIKEVRTTVDQNLLVRFIPQGKLEEFETGIKQLGLDKPGAGSFVDITACPGTDTCNLGITSSKGLAEKLSEIIEAEWPKSIEQPLTIKISGCPNSCGQQQIADIGFYGATYKKEGKSYPSYFMFIGGGVDAQGAHFGQKMVQVPARQVPDIVKTLVRYFRDTAQEGENYRLWLERVGVDSVRNFLKGLLADLPPVANAIDFRSDDTYEFQRGVGECAGAPAGDVIEFLLIKSQEYLYSAQRFIDQKQWADAAYSTYTSWIWSSRALVMESGETLSSQKAILEFVEEHWISKGDSLKQFRKFKNTVTEISRKEPDHVFSTNYFVNAKQFLRSVKEVLTQYKN